MRLESNWLGRNSPKLQIFKIQSMTFFLILLPLWAWTSWKCSSLIMVACPKSSPYEEIDVRMKVLLFLYISNEAKIKKLGSGNHVLHAVLECSWGPQKYHVQGPKDTNILLRKWKYENWTAANFEKLTTKYKVHWRNCSVSCNRVRVGVIFCHGTELSTV